MELTKSMYGVIQSNILKISFNNFEETIETALDSVSTESILEKWESTIGYIDNRIH